MKLREQGLARQKDFEVDLGHQYFLHYRSLFADLKKASIRARGRLLDIGCGNKPYEKMFSGITEYIGCDMIQSSENRVDIICPATELPFAEASFDTVLITQVIEHVADHQSLLSEAFRVLKSNGVVILSGPMYWPLHEEPYDFFRFTKHGFRFLLENSGFVGIDIVNNGGKWALCGQVLIHSIRDTRIYGPSVIYIINKIFSYLDDRRTIDNNPMNYVVVARKSPIIPDNTAVNNIKKVSIVIPCFNHGKFLAEALASVSQINRDDIELIIVDDGSTDDFTIQELEILSQKGVNILRQKNRGVAAARNAGINISKGEYILPLDADNYLRPEYIEHGIRILDENPRVGIVYGDAQYFGIRTDRWNVGSFERERLLRWNYIDACAIYRRSIWVQNNGYDTSMPVQGLEDWDFWLGALAQNWDFEYLPEIMFDYRVAEESMITRTFGFVDEITDFISKKHGHLYRQVWQSQFSEIDFLKQKLNTFENDRKSFKSIFHNLLRLIKSRLLG